MMVKVKVVVHVCLFCLAVGAVGACGGDSQYRLPPPPAQEEQRDVAVDPAEQASLERERYLEARASLLELYGLLSKERFEEAEGYLSQQTRDFLAYGSQAADASAVLSAGELTLPNGRTIAFEPVELLIGGKVQRIADTVEGAEEHETQRRRELFVVDAQGDHHKAVMIVEGDRWVLHKTSVDPNQEQ